jgi:acetyltransferase
VSDGETSGSGSALLKAVTESGYQGEISAVGLNIRSLRCVKTYRCLTDIPDSPDLAVICGPIETVLERVRECGESGVRGLIIISTAHSGEEKALARRISEEARCFEGMRIMGPASFGILVPSLHLNASLGISLPKKGSVAFASQSASLCPAVLDWAEEEDIGFSHFVSMGEMIDVDFGDLIDYFSTDEETKSIVLFAESITAARKFVSASRAFTRTKPIVVLKAGRYATSDRTMTSPALTFLGEDVIYQAAFERAGVVRVLETDEMFDCAELLSRHRLPRGERLGIITNADSSGIVAADTLMDLRGTLASPSDESAQQLRRITKHHFFVGNPLRIPADASPDFYADAIRVLLADRGVDAVLVILTPQMSTDPTRTARALVKVAEQFSKPLLTAWMGGRLVKRGTEILNEAGIPTYATPEKAVRAFMHLVSYTRNREILYETPREIPIAFSMDREEIKRKFEASISGPQETLSETQSKSLLEAYGIAVTLPILAESEEEALTAAHRMGYPVVLKIHSREIIHKSEVDGVVLNLHNDDELRHSFRKIISNAESNRPDADVEGVTVQPMATSPDGLEMVLGAVKDPVFGSAIFVGMGGIATEFLKDWSIELPPLNERLARRMLESLRSWSLLQGYRGRPGVKMESLIETLIRFSYLVADFPQLMSIDVNPLWVTSEDVLALDARITLDRTVLERPVQPYEHLAIRPYPDQYVRTVELIDGTSIVLRPIKPEDEPRWLDMLYGCSRTTLYQRFQYAFKRTHEMASRFCFIDYDREMAIIAELKEQGVVKIVGVGRLAADLNHETAEYAVLVTDRWQGRGLGSRITDYCLEIAKGWDLRRLTAITTPDNSRALGLVRSRGFHIVEGPEDGVVTVQKRLA